MSVNATASSRDLLLAFGGFLKSTDVSPHLLDSDAGMLRKVKGAEITYAGLMRDDLQ